jgi:hypothetical protein
MLLLKGRIELKSMKWRGYIRTPGRQKAIQDKGQWKLDKLPFAILFFLFFFIYLYLKAKRKAFFWHRLGHPLN